MNNAQEILESDDFKRCATFHGHICGGLAIGYKAATTGLAWLEEQRALDEELVAIVETDACCVDAIQVLTGCTFGKGNLIYKDYGKMGFTFFNRRTGTGVRLAMKPDSFRVNERQIELFKKTRDGKITEAERAELDELGAQRTAEVLNIPAEDLFVVMPVTAGMPDKARIEPSQPCSRCGEPTMASKLESVDGTMVCRGCLA
ncbi:formylmethanofuran dehydrogenase subunit E [Desulfosarcina ovata subsp. sediminis]|uniref:Formylmethanofuran dehydrogenase subunit E n=1 Tax=Desulfosarcina ovata subsp. sediminis TaxID=885957 RepID=A0A5K7ZP67_9BACT|nr:FmdE family protein [Desulfosarcina ovata]BBO82287.1 formylmethanofuran dehydrogenase subunit E [Desulfosarcina ovata subsp. sediminis]